MLLLLVLVAVVGRMVGIEAEAEAEVETEVGGAVVVLPLPTTDVCPELSSTIPLLPLLLTVTLSLLLLLLGIVLKAMNSFKMSHNKLSGCSTSRFTPSALVGMSKFASTTL